MKSRYTYETREISENIQGFITKLVAILILGLLPVLAFSSVPAGTDHSTGPIILEINMAGDESQGDNILKDTLCVRIFETTTGDEYILNTTTGFISIPLATDKHYFIYMSKRGSVTQSIEFYTTGSQNSQSRTFFIDYGPEEINELNGIEEVPMSIVKFDNDSNGSVIVNQLGVSVFHD